MQFKEGRLEGRPFCLERAAWPLYRLIVAAGAPQLSAIDFVWWSITRPRLDKPGRPLRLSGAFDLGGSLGRDLLARGGDSRASPVLDSDARGLAIAVAGVSVIWLIAVARWYLDDSVVPWDSKNQFYAFFRFLADSMHAGTSVFWNPYHYGGHPSIADPQSLVFSPPFVLWALFDPTPSLRAFDLIVQLHLLAGGLAMAGLGWRRGWPAPASILAAAIFMLGGAASARLNHTGIILSYGLFPVALLTLEIALERRSLVYAMLFAIITSTIVLGRNQVALMLSLMLVAVVLREIALAPAPLEFLRQRFGMLVLIVVAGIAMTAVPVLLSLQLAVLSNRPAVLLAEALEASLHPSNLANALFPNVFGSHAAGYHYWGPHYTITPEVAATDGSFNYIFAGAAPMLLLLWLGVAGGRLGGRGARMLSIMFLVALMFTLGRYTPLFPFVFEHVPGFSYFRRPVDATFVMVILMALISGHLLADYVSRGAPALRPLPLACVLAGGIAIGFSAWSIVGMTHHQREALWAVGQGLLPLVAAGAVLYLWRAPERRILAASCFVLVAAGELLLWNAASRLNAEPIQNYALLERSTPEDAEAMRLLGGEIARRQAEGARPRVEIVGLGGQWQNLSMIRKIEATTGYNPLRIGIYDRYVAPSETGWLASARRFPASFDGYDCALAQALGLEYLVIDRPIEDLKQMSRPSRLEPLMTGPRVWIYRIPGAMPRVKFGSRIRVADLDATRSSGELVNPPQRDEIAIDSDTPPTVPAWLGALNEARNSARIASWRPGEIVVEVNAAGPGVLVLHDTYYPGWTATLDGKPVPILRAEVLFRGVEVPAGLHKVVFRFEPLRLANLVRAARDVASGRKKQETAGEPDWLVSTSEQE